MKTVSGKVIDTKKISLSKAARYISNFVTVDETGASQAVSAYLTRAAASFNELVQLHKELKGSKNSDRKPKKKHEQERANKKESLKGERKPKENEGGRNAEDSVGSHGARKMHEKKKHGDLEVEGGGSLVIEETSRKEKKRKSRDADEGEAEDLGDRSSSKKKKRRRKVEVED